MIVLEKKLMNDFLFICTANMLRSPTCEHVARSMGFSADSAGTWDLAIRRVTKEQIEKANYIICMEQKHANELTELHGYPEQGIIVWAIPDDFDYCQKELIDLIKPRLTSFKPSYNYPTRT